MCGISGLIGMRGTLASARERVLKMVGTLVHRGPDGDGVWVDSNVPVCLGHNRLAILDPSAAGAQPMMSSSRRFVATFNGEIYNFRSLRAERDRRAHGPRNWRGHCDTEVLVEAIDAWGVEQAVARMEGMFAFAVWDREQRVLWLVRDRMGEKPLYYGETRGDFVFASELKAFSGASEDALTVDSSVLCEYLRAGHIAAPHTIYRGIRKLSAGHFARIQVQSRSWVQGEPQRYWSMGDLGSPRRRTASRNEWCVETERMEQVLHEAVAERMVSDVPVGAFLSGGIDSSLLVALMTLEAPAVHTFTVGFDIDGCDESRFARAVASHFHAQHTDVTITAADALRLIPTLGSIFDEPFADPSQIPTCLLAELARRDITVVLSGEGADELFGGYDKYFAARRIWRLLSRVSVPVRGWLSQALLAPSVHAWNGLMRRVSREPLHGDRLDGERIHKLAATLPAQNRQEFYSLLSGNWRPASDAVHLSGDSIQPRQLDVPAPDFFHEMMATDINSALPDGILTKVDRATMAVGLEARAPFLAENVVKFAWSLPVELKVGSRQGKLILRRILARHLPREIWNRPKVGFSAPLESWLRGALRPWAEELLSHTRLEAGGFRANAVREKWLQHVSGTHNWQYALWPVLMWQAFFDEIQHTHGSRTQGLPDDISGGAKPSRVRHAHPIATTLR
jgi:asparagine synthase (glutamine-hydrolysing)